MPDGQTRYLIVNADDFGLAPRVNQAVLTAYTQGVLTSASILANMPGFLQAAEIAVSNPNLSVGVHLNAVRGRPLSGSRFDATFITDNRFNISRSVLWSLPGGLLASLEREYRFQIERCLDSGIKVSHLDSEKHHAATSHPRIQLLMLQLAGEYQIPAIRCLREPLFSALRHQSWPGWKAMLASIFMRWRVTLLQDQKILTENNIKQPHHFLGQYSIANLTMHNWKKIISHLPIGISEIMTHPGYSAPDEVITYEPECGQSYLDELRQEQLTVLCNPELRQIIDKHKIKLINYHEITKINTL